MTTLTENGEIDLVFWKVVNVSSASNKSEYWKSSRS